MANGPELKRCKEGQISFLKGGKGKTFLLLHGIPGSSLAWEKVGVQLTDHFQIIIPDLLGFGQSDIPKSDYYLESQARAIRQLLTTLDINDFYLCGHDFGGPVGITLMRLYPELKIMGLVLSATNIFTDTYVPPPLRVAKIPLLGTFTFKLMVGNRIGLRMMYQAAAKNKANYKWLNFQQHLTPSGIDFTRRIFQRSLADLQTNYQAIENMLPHLELRSLILWGDSDPFFATTVAERTQQMIQNSQLKIYKNTGHFVPEERPILVAEDIVDFFGQG